MTSRLNGAGVISGNGVPTADIFPRATSDGTPLYLDLDSGIIYYLDDSNVVQDVKWTSSKGITTADSPYTQLSTDNILVCDATAGDITLNLLPATDWPNKRLVVKKINSGNQVVVTPDGTERIDGAASDTLSAHYASTEYFAYNDEIWTI